VTFTRPSRTLAPLVLLCSALPSAAAPAVGPPSRGLFLGYELTEMSMNRFRNFAGEAGYRFGPRYRLRLSAMEVDVTERDLAGWWSAAVDGRGDARPARGQPDTDRRDRGRLLSQRPVRRPAPAARRQHASPVLLRRYRRDPPRLREGARPQGRAEHLGLPRLRVQTAQSLSATSAFNLWIAASSRQ
jgi:hypothetical protein